MRLTILLAAKYSWHHNIFPVQFASATRSNDIKDKLVRFAYNWNDEILVYWYLGSRIKECWI